MAMSSTGINLERVKLSDTELDFLVEGAAPDVKDKARLKQLIQEDDDFRSAFVSDEKIFDRVVADEEILLKISPALYFEILLRKTLKELKKASYTMEKAGAERIAVFDANEAADLLARRPVLAYLADMLSSFTKVESYALSFRVRKGLWRKIRFSDLDIDSLIRFCETVDEEYRLGFYKRIADICLFTLGVFPEYARFDYRYPFSGQLRPPIPGRRRRGPEDYEMEGRKFYQLAAEHQAAKSLDLADTFWLLHGKFTAARKPLNFIADHYLHHARKRLFNSGGN